MFSDTAVPNLQARLIFSWATQALVSVYINFHKVEKSHYEGKTWVRMKQMSFTVFLAQCCVPVPHCLPWNAVKPPRSETFFWLLMTMLQSGNQRGC